jgi:hypothetical protein
LVNWEIRRMRKAAAPPGREKRAASGTLRVRLPAMTAIGVSDYEGCLGREGTGSDFYRENESIIWHLWR